MKEALNFGDFVASILYHNYFISLVYGLAAYNFYKLGKNYGLLQKYGAYRVNLKVPEEISETTLIPLSSVYEQSNIKISNVKLLYLKTR